MLKRILLFVFCIYLLGTEISSVLFMFTDKTLDPELKNKVDFVSSENETRHIEYMNVAFFPHLEDLLCIDELDDDVFLGWTGAWWGYKNRYFSDRSNSPLFIYETRLNCLYLQADYDFKTDFFIVEGTSSDILFSDAILSKSDLDLDDNTVDGIDVILYSKTCPRLKLLLRVFSYQNEWYASIRHSTGFREIYKVSEDLIQILKNHKIISC